MKNLLIILSLLISTTIFSQNKIDIKITDITKDNIEVTLYPNYSEVSTMSNIQFTFTWKTNQQIIIGNPKLNEIIEIQQSGPVLVDGKNKYQIFAGFNMNKVTITKPFVINFPKVGNGKITIADDEFVSNVLINGEFYASIAGMNVTGMILESDLKIKNDITVFYDPFSQQIIYLQNGSYTNNLGQTMNIPNQSRLIFVGHK